MADLQGEWEAPWPTHRPPADLWRNPPGRPSNFVCGLPSCLRDPASRRVVAEVLGTIEDRFPQDFARLKDRVAMIRPLSEAEFARGTRGEWLGRTGWAVYREIDETTIPPEVLDRMQEWVCGIVELPEVGWVTEESLAANAAHEFGHACTLRADIERRQAPDEEWGSEAAADWYAYKWGFGRLISRTRKARALGHHGPSPGKLVTLGHAGLTFRLSRNFIYQQVEQAPMHC